MQTMDPMAEQKTKGTVCLVLGGLLLVGGIIFGVAMIVNGVTEFSRSIDRMQRVPLTSGGTVDLPSGGTYRVYLERPGTTTDPFEISGNLPGITIVDPSGGLHALDGDNVDETYSYNGRSGHTLGHFVAPTAGTYRIRVTGADGAGIGTLAVAKRGPFHAVAPILGGIFGGGAMAVAGIVLLVIGGIRRSRSRRVALGPMTGWAPPPGAWGAPAPNAPAGWTPPPQPGYGWAPPPVVGPSWTQPPAGPPYGTPPTGPVYGTPPPPMSPPPPPPPPGPAAPPRGPDDAGWGAPGAGS